MKVLIEGGSVLRQRSGVGQYTKRLIEAMAAQAPDNRYTVFAFWSRLRRRPERVFNGRSSIKVRLIGFLPGRIYTGLFKLGLAPPVNLLMRERADIVWFPNFVLWPLFGRAKKIVTIYDLSFINFGQFASPANRAYMERFVPKAVKKADHVVTISEYSKQEIVEHYKIAPEKISIVYPAIDPTEYHPRSAAEISKVRQKYGLGENYLLYVGTLEPRKNIEGILDAYASLPDELKQKHPLVLAGGKGWLDESISRKIEEFKSRKLPVYQLGYVPDEDLPALYSGAALFVYPSFYEGFGMPPLEAMACGAAVITANNSSLPEVVGKAGLMVSANDTAQLSSAMAELLGSDDKRRTLIAAGLAQSKKFAWDKSAADMLAVMNQTAER